MLAHGANRGIKYDLAPTAREAGVRIGRAFLKSLEPLIDLHHPAA